MRQWLARLSCAPSKSHERATTNPTPASKAYTGASHSMVMATSDVDPACSRGGLGLLGTTTAAEGTQSRAAITSAQRRRRRGDATGCARACVHIPATNPTQSKTTAT